MAYKLIWSPASRDDLRHIVTSFPATAASEQKRSAIASSPKPTSYRTFPRWADPFLNTTCQLSVKSLFGPIGSFTASITNGSWLRSRESGMQREARQSSEGNQPTTVR